MGDGGVTIGLINYNNIDMVARCIESVLRQKGGPYRLIFVDNASTDGSRELVLDRFSDRLEIVLLDENRGPNPARNIILGKAKTEYVAFLDADVVLEEEVMKKLLAALESDPGAAAASPKVMDFKSGSRLQFAGTLIHYIGAAIHLRENRTDTFRVTSLGGACLFCRRQVAVEIGGWDEDLFFGWTDGDFVYRCVMAGYGAVCVGSSAVFHPAKVRGLSRAYYQIRNRWYFILKIYSIRTLVLIFPMIVLYEGFLLGFMILRRQSSTYFRACTDVLRLLPVILKKRGKVQSSRKARDGELLSTGDFTVRGDVAGRSQRFISLFNKGLDLYWSAVRRAC